MIKTGAKQRGRGGICISLVGKYPVWGVESPIKKKSTICLLTNCLVSILSVDIISRNLTYKAVLKTHLLPTTQRDFPDGDGMFQQDLSQCHTSRKMRRFFEESGLTALEWPGNSDINQLKNLWAIIKHRLQKEVCSTMQTMISAVIKV